VTGTCTRCGRVLHGERAIRRGYGWRCYARVQRAARVLQASANLAAAKAAEALTDGAVVRHPHRGVYWVVSSDGARRYLTHPCGCTCQAGLHARLCYHRVAVSILAA
jgi:hypothetical protein